MSEYSDFIERKIKSVAPQGFSEPPELGKYLFPWQAAIVAWALRRGRAALFTDTGTGKTRMSLEWARVVCKHTGGDVLILAPLAVSAQTAREGESIGIPVNVCRRQADVKPGINITNYEMLEHFDAGRFVGVVLDESSILKQYMGKTKRRIISAFMATRWKLSATATPSPNDHMEILNQAAFLGIMESSEALARWFINDQGQAGKYRLKGHAEKDFWRWVSSWAVALSRPSDLGFDDEGYNLPPLRVVDHVVDVDQTVESGDTLFRMPTMSATGYHKEKRISSDARALRVAELVSSYCDDQCIVWCETNYESDATVKALKAAGVDGVVEVRGNDKASAKEKAAIDFADGRIHVLVSKSSIFGFGMNFQSCHRVLFNGLSFSFESYYQAVRRSWRFGQRHTVTVDIVVGSGENEVISTVRRKEEDHETLKKSMVAAIGEHSDVYGLNARSSFECERETANGDGWTVMLGDCVEEIRLVEPNSVDLILHSPPFSSLYIYSPSLRDMGNCHDDDEFFEHYEHLIPWLYKALRPGRVCAVHCKQLVDYRGRDGRAGLRDFRGEIIRAFERHGFKYHSEVTVWTDPVTEMHRTKAHGLLYKQLRADSSFSRAGLPDYVVVFRKWPEEGEEDIVSPVTHTKDNFPLEQWQEWASPVWMTVNRMNCLNVQESRDDKDERHICPLQLDIIERVVGLYSNPGDLVLDPFSGLGSTGVMALKMKRRYLGFELKRRYWEQSFAHLNKAASQLELF